MFVNVAGTYKLFVNLAAPTGCKGLIFYLTGFRLAVHASANPIAEV